MARKWDRHSIHAAVRRAGTTLTQLAMDNQLEHSACRQALIRPNLLGEIAIANFLNIDPALLWPERYRDGQMSNGRSNALGRFRASQKLWSAA